MPKPGNFQFGYEHRLFVGDVPLTGRDYTVGDPFPAGTKTYNNVTWSVADIVRDVSVGGSENTVDITTRDEARKGFTVEPIVSQTGEMTFQLRWEPSAQADLSDINAVFKKLLKAWRSRTNVSILEVDAAYNATTHATAANEGVQGIVGNFSINFNWPKPVQGVVVVDVSARLVGFPDWVVHSAVAYTAPTTAADVITVISAGGFRPIEEIA